MYFETTHVKRYYIVLPKSFTRGRRWMGWTMVVVVVLVVEVGVWFTSPSVCLSVCTLERLDPFVCFIVLFRSHFLNDR